MNFSILQRNSICLALNINNIGALGIETVFFFALATIQIAKKI
jgi:hypothetical protein